MLGSNVCDAKHALWFRSPHYYCVQQLYSTMWSLSFIATSNSLPWHLLEEDWQKNRVGATFTSNVRALKVLLDQIPRRQSTAALVDFDCFCQENRSSTCWGPSCSHTRTQYDTNTFGLFWLLSSDSLFGQNRCAKPPKTESQKAA